jgi:hypothetical protein
LNTQLFIRAIPEIINAFQFSVKNKKTVKFFICFAQGVFRRVRNKPPREFSTLKIKINKRLNQILRLNKSLLNSKNETSADIYSLQEVEVSLAGTKRRLCYQNLWDIDYKDIEELFALHRFGWLLVAYVEEDLSWQEGIKYIAKWDIDNNDLNGVGWDSYSIAERLSNWVSFLYLKNFQTNEVTNETLKIRIFRQALYLMQNLEFRGPATNNHIINNGRALYLVGLYLNNGTFQQTGREILLASIDLMFTHSGFLREGSSHYHILLTRSYLEVLIYSQRYKDHEFGKLLNKRVEKIWKAACFFLEAQPFPVFGDVSPDFLTSFHYGLGKVGSCIFAKPFFGNITSGVGWHNLFPDVLKKKSFLKEPKNCHIYHSDAGYIKFRNERIIFYAYINPLGYVPAWSHGHSDLGGYILYLDGQCILIGTGRKNYLHYPGADYWRSAKSHNSITIDNKGLCPVHGLDSLPEFILPDYFQKPVVEIKKQKDCNSFEIKLSVKMIISYGEDVKVSRKFLINDDVMTIEDKVTGKGEHLISSCFHFPANLHLESNVNNPSEFTLFDNSHKQRLLFSWPKENYGEMISYTKKREQTLGWCSPEYGMLQHCNSIMFKQMKVLPLESTYRFSFTHRT